MRSSCPAFSWLDVDGDGQRDLLVAIYASNSQIEAVLKRTGKTFGDIGHVFEELWYMHDADEIFAWDCKGCDEDAVWVRINGRVYRAFRNGGFGINEVFLLRPLKGNIEAPRIVVKYGYSVKVVYDKSGMFPQNDPRRWQEELLFPYTVQNRRSLQAATTKILELLKGQSKSPFRKKSSALCPIPKGTPKGDWSTYTQYAEESYPAEVVDFPIWVERICYIARLISMPLYTREDGIFAHLLVRKADANLSLSDSDWDTDTFRVIGRRYVVGIDSGLAVSPRY